jgi:hypothetical protein
VAISWHEKARKFKSRLSVVAAFLLRSRETQRARNQQLQEQARQRDEQRARDSQQIARQQRQIEALRRRCVELEKERDEARQAVHLPADPPVTTHGYGARMVSLAGNLAKSVGLRGAERVLKLFFEWLGVSCKLPSRTTIRAWLQRLGVAELKRPLEPSEDLVVMADHSIQIGTEKVLVALGVKASELPEPGTALQHHHVRVLHVALSSNWKTEDMEREYRAMAERYGDPRAVLTDGALELRKGAKCLQKRRPDTSVLGDLKHYAAIVLKSLIGNDERFKEVSAKLGSTRAAIQQTELAHLAPPSARPKARFMNLAATMRWMTMIVWLLRHPEARGRAGISAERMQEKLGWVAEYAADIDVWHECQQVVSKSLTFINEQYLFCGASQALGRALSDSQKHEKSRELARRLIDFVHQAEQHLRKGERLPMSTEILESTFGLYKQLEGQHAKSGFTGLLACFPALLKPSTPESVTAAFRSVSNRDVKAWLQERFGSTVTARRQAALAEHKAAQKRATTQPVLD